MLSDLRYRVRALFRRSAVEGELDDELRFHFEQQVDKLVRAGLTRSEAVRRTRLAFGGMEQVKEECREARGLSAAEALAQDLRHALRLWGKNPGFALAAVTAIALGIGVNAAVFTIANAALFKTLAYERSGHIVYILGQEPGCELPCDTGRSYPDFQEFRAQAKSFAAMVAYHFSPVNLSDENTPERYRAMQISANGFSAFGVKPVAGRDFIAADERPDAAPVAMLAYALWQRRYGKDASIIGKQVRVNEVATTVIGVMPTQMQLRTGADLWMPLVPTGDWRKRAYRGAMMLGRLADGVRLKSARAELDTISRRLASAYPAADRDIGILAMEGKDYLNPRIRLVLTGLWIVVGLVLLVACANVANLLLGRAVERSREISIRVALGAGRWRVIRQLLAESVTLSAAGGVVGWLLAVWGVRAFDRAIAAGKPPWLDFSMDYTVVAYLAAISIGAGLLFGLAPALQLSRVDVNAALKEGGRGMSGGARARRLSSLLVTGEMAAAVVLLVGTVLVVRTLVKSYQSPVGVNTANVLTMHVDLPEKKYPRPNDTVSFYERLRARLQALPGVESASVASSLPGQDGMDFAYDLEGAGPADTHRRPTVRGLVVGAGYFHAMRVRPLEGREFTGADDAAGTPAVIVNRSFAAKFWPDGNVGKRLRLVEEGAPPVWLTAVGVVPDIWQNDQRREFEPLIYLPFSQHPLAGMSIVARTRVPPATLGQAFRRGVQAIDDDLPVFALRTLDEEIRLHDTDARALGAMFGIFTAIAMLLAAVGLYAVVAHSVNRRTQEIGVRLALGATAGNIVASVFVQGMRQVAFGLAVGLAAAFGLARVLRAVLAGLVRPDWVTFAIVALVLLAAGALACAIPARRATRVDPVVALRFE